MDARRSRSASTCAFFGPNLRHRTTCRREWVGGGVRQRSALCCGLGRTLPRMSMTVQSAGSSSPRASHRGTRASLQRSSKESPS
eukprot:6477009-Prymnesium_polylepis.2